VANNLYKEKIRNVNNMAAKLKEMIEDVRKKQVDEIFQLWSKLVKTIEDENNKINKIYEELERF
jgi:hypothetical protein